MSNFRNAKFWLDKVAFLNHMASTYGIQVNSKKIEAILEWPVSTIIMEVTCFLSLTGYYRRFVKDFSKVTVPLARLTQKNVKFNWTDRWKEHF